MPTTRASSNPSPQQARRGQGTNRQHIDIEAGCILWLPKKEAIDVNLLSDIEIDDGCFHHPIVVLSTELARGEVTVLIEKLTSFDGQDLAVKHPTKGHQRDHHLPIYPSAIHPDNGIQLSLQNNAKLRKRSYIKTETKYTINAASLDPYCRSGKEYKLKEISRNELKAYIKSTPPTSHPSLQSDQLDRSFEYPSTPNLGLLNAPHSSSWTTQRTLLQIPSTPYTPATSRSVSTSTSQAPVSPPLYQTRVVPRTWQDSHMYNDPQRTRQVSVQPYTQPSSTPSPSPPEPDFSAVAAFIVPLLFLGSMGAVTYASYRLLNLGNWALKEIKGKWSDPRVLLVREKGLQLIRATLKGSVSMIWSVDGTALFDSIKNRIGGIHQGLKAYQIYIWHYLGNYHPIISHLVETSFNLLNPS